MKTIDTYTGKYTVKVAVPETVEEFDSLAKKEGAAIQAAVTQEIYHGTLGDIRSAAEELINEAYKATRRDVGTGLFDNVDGKNVEITKEEKWDVYLNRVATENNLTGDTPFQHIFDRLSVGGDKEVKFDPAAQKRTGTGPKIPVIDYTRAKEFITGVINKATGKAYDLGKFTAAFHRLLGKELVITGDTEDAKIKSLAPQINEWRKAREAQDASKF
jgi:hypothetical protein